MDLTNPVKKAYLKIGLLRKKTLSYKRRFLNGAGEENRTLVSTLARSRSTIEPRPQNLLDYLSIIANLHETHKFYFLPFLLAVVWVALGVVLTAGAYPRGVGPKSWDAIPFK